MKKNILRTNFFKYFLLIFISSIVYIDWYSDNIFAYGDLSFYTNNFFLYLNSSSTLTNSSGLGEFNYSLWNIPYISIFYYLVSLGYAYPLVQNIFILVLSTLLLPVSCYFFLEYLFKNKNYAFIGSLFFSYNPYFISIISQGHYNLVLSNALLFLSLTFYLKLLKYYGVNIFYLFVLSTCYIIYIDLRVFYMGLPLYIFFLAYEIYKSLKINEIFRLKYLVKLNIALAFIIVSLNLFWILPFIVNNNENIILSRSLIKNTFNDVSYSLLLQHPFWSLGSLEWFEKKPFLIYRFFYIVIFVYLLYLIKKINSQKVILYFFSLIFLLGVFLTKMNDIPLPGVYEYLFSTFPGFSAFREPTKFFFYTYLGYCVILTGVLSKIKSYISSKLIVFIIIFDILFIIYPIVFNIYEYTFKAKAVPNSYISLEKYLNEQNEIFNFLYVPCNYIYKIGSKNNIPLCHSNISSNLSHLRSNESFTNVVEKSGISINLLLQDFSDNLVDQYGIKYLVIPEDSKDSNNNLFRYFGGKRYIYTSYLDNLTYINKINLPESSFDIYENYNHKSIIYKTFQKESVFNSVESKDVAFKKYSNTHYRIFIGSDFLNEKDFYINFISYYDTNWGLYLLDANSKIKIDNKYLIKKDSSLMAYYIDIEYIRSQLNSIIDKNYEYYVFELVYEPQKYLKIGLYIWLSVFTYLTSLTIILNLYNLKKRS